MTIRVNGDRLNQSLMSSAKIGATPGGGVTRLALSDEDRAGAICCALDDGGRARAAGRRLSAT